MNTENKPAFVHRDGMLSDARYVEWLSDVKTRFCRSQIKASVRVNISMLEFYWSIGRDLVAMRAEERWGAGVVKQFALDMRQAFPDITGFSDSNVKFMRQWYSFYCQRIKIGYQPCGQLEGKNSHQHGGLLEMPDIFGRVPWKHHVLIVSKCQSLNEALFYVNKVSESFRFPVDESRI